MRVRRWVTLVTAAVFAAGGLVGAGAGPAAADPQGGTLRGVYYDGQFCNSYGSEGVHSGQWSWFYCEYRQYGPGGPGYYFLWTFTY